jgi:hypothetical protein
VAVGAPAATVAEFLEPRQPTNHHPGHNKFHCSRHARLGGSRIAVGYAAGRRINQIPPMLSGNKPIKNKKNEPAMGPSEVTGLAETGSVVE